MKELIQALIECMTEETDRYQKLVALSEQQKDLLITGKMDALKENIRLEEKEVFALGPLKAKRGDLLKKLATSYGLPSLSLMEAVKRAPVEAVKEFKKAVIELVRTAKQLDAVNKVNGKLLNNGLSYVKFTLKAIVNGGKKKAYKPLVALGEKPASFVNRVV